MPPAVLDTAALLRLADAKEQLAREPGFTPAERQHLLEQAQLCRAGLQPDSARGVMHYAKQFGVTSIDQVVAGVADLQSKQAVFPTASLSHEARNQLTANGINPDAAAHWARKFGAKDPEATIEGELAKQRARGGR